MMMGLALVNLMQLALRAAVLCEIMRNDVPFSTDRKPVCDFLLVSLLSYVLCHTVSQLSPSLFTGGGSVWLPRLG